MEPVSGTVVSRPAGASFFSGFLHPSLLSASPLEQIIAYLADEEINEFCFSHKAAQEIFPRLVMKQLHKLTMKQWLKIAQRNGPIIRRVQLNGLTELGLIPASVRNQIKEVRFQKLGGPVAPELIPTKLEVFNSGDDNTHGYDRYLRGPELPVMPPTLKQFCFGFRMKEAGDDGGDNEEEEEEKDQDEEEEEEEDEDGDVDAKKPTKEKSVVVGNESATQMIKRVLSQATQLTDVSISVEEGGVIRALPSTVERLSVHMYASDIGDSWPKSLKHLTVQTDNECEVELDPIIPPPGLISLAMPSEWDYQYYGETMAEVAKMENLREISFGTGIGSFGNDLFADLPKNIKSVKYNDSMSLEGSNETDVNSLPDSVEELVWAVNNDEVKKWPSHLRILSILGDDFAQDITNLPNTVSVLHLPSNYIRPVSKWPASLTELALGAQFIDISSIERLPATLRTLTMSLPLARKLMKSGKLPAGLTELTLLGQPNRTQPFDLSALPISVEYLTFDSAVPTLINRSARPALRFRHQRLTRDLNEDDMEANFAILNDPNMSPDIDDPEETEPFIPKRDDEWRTPNRVPEPAEIQSQALFYTEPDYNDVHKELEKLHELVYESGHSHWGPPPTPVPELLERLAKATPESPITGISIKEVKSAPLLRAIRDALQRGAIVGNFTMIECKSAPPEPERSSWQQTGNGPLVEVPPPPSPFTFLPEDYDPIKAADVMIQLLAALPHSKISRIKIATPRELFDLNPKEEMESKKSGQLVMPIGFSTLCTSISRMPSLRTLVFRNCWNLGTTRGQMDLLFRSILQNPSIENVDLCDIKLGLGLPSVVELIKQTKTLKRLVLSRGEIKVGGLYQICQGVIGNQSLISLNLAGNPTSLAGLGVIRHALRNNPRIEITVCHLDFGSTGMNQLGPKRHRRLKESRRIYRDGSISGHDMELQ